MFGPNLLFFWVLKVKATGSWSTWPRNVVGHDLDPLPPLTTHLSLMSIPPLTIKTMILGGSDFRGL